MSPSETGRKSLFRTLQPLVLASSSPRRREMLTAMGLSFEVVPSEIDETGGEGEAPRSLVEGWAREKAQVVSRLFPDRWILAADTIVVLGGTIFGKPQHADDAAGMLRQLSGRRHEVISGICLVHGLRHFVHVRSVRTLVHFKPLNDVEIAAYVATGESIDKAGAYGIQGMGAFLVRSIEGSYTNVVGLPLCETLEDLTANGVIAPVAPASCKRNEGL